MENTKAEANIFFYHPDHLGSTALVTDADGEVTQHVAYIPYGEVFIEERNGVWNTPYLFNAKDLDEETGLYYYGARYLNPKDTRWLSVDPMFEKYVGMTPYHYCNGNPVVMVDPNGMEGEQSALTGVVKHSQWMLGPVGIFTQKITQKVIEFAEEKTGGKFYISWDLTAGVKGELNLNGNGVSVDAVSTSISHGKIGGSTPGGITYGTDIHLASDVPHIKVHHGVSVEIGPTESKDIQKIGPWSGTISTEPVKMEAECTYDFYITENGFFIYNYQSSVDGIDNQSEQNAPSPQSEGDESGVESKDVFSFKIGGIINLEIKFGFDFEKEK